MHSLNLIPATHYGNYTVI